MTTDSITTAARFRQSGRPQPFRSRRPPMALLTILDDGISTTGEEHRLRQSKTTIGRLNADIALPHDNEISATHAEIQRLRQNGGFCWQLSDLKTTNGSFVRMTSSELSGGTEIMVGSHRYRFQAAQVLANELADEPRSTIQSCAIRASDSHNDQPQLVDISREQGERRHTLQGTGTLVGSDHCRCQIVVDDPFADRVHAEILQQASSRWLIRDRGSLNGLWVRRTNCRLESGTEFLLGGQRFRFDLC